jgi:hypothetical protein
VKVIHATHCGTHAFAARSLETGDEAIVLTTPYQHPMVLTVPLCGEINSVGLPCAKNKMNGGPCWWHRSAP